MNTIFILVIIADLGPTFPRPWEMPVAAYSTMEFCAKAREYYASDPTLKPYLTYRCNEIEIRR